MEEQERNKQISREIFGVEPSGDVVRYYGDDGSGALSVLREMENKGYEFMYASSENGAGYITTLYRGRDDSCFKEFNTDWRSSICNCSLKAIRSKIRG